jgi:RNA polymerase sigma factor (sigma-70 family)
VLTVETVAEPHPLDDRALMTAVREGDPESFVHLYQRHVAAAAAYARRLVRQRADEHDVVADAFLRVLGILSRGKGPQDTFRPYLLRAVRNAAYDRARAERRLELTDEPCVLEGVQPFRDTAVERFDRDRVLQAFRSLPARWQDVLSLTLIEELPVEVAAARLGINPNSLSSLAYRAREGLRQAYLRTSLTSADPACHRVAGALSRFVRGTVARTDRRLVEEHFTTCTACQARIRELRETDGVLWDRSVTAIPAMRPADRPRGTQHTARSALVQPSRTEPDDYRVSV